MKLVTRYYQNVRYVSGPLLFLEGGRHFCNGAIVDILLPDGEKRTGQVLEISEEHTIVQVVEATDRIGLQGTAITLRESAAKLKLSPAMLGRVYNGSGRPIDGLDEGVYAEKRDINGAPINPVARAKPDLFIETGITAIDAFNTLVRGQKLPVFSGAGLPANEIVSFLLENARSGGDDGKDDELVVVFGAMGITRREAAAYMDRIRISKSARRLITFMNLADDPTIERLITPRCALTAAEYFAFTLGMHVLVVLTDITNYCEALREVSAAREEIPGRRGYPGFMYTDLASLYERAGIIDGKPGSITQIGVLTMPDDDITHPIIDLTGYITEGQIVLDRRLHRRGVMPPIDVLPSLSRLMNNGIGKGKTREDHRDLVNQLYASYANGIDVRRLASIVGEEALTELDKKYLDFAHRFETELVNQGTRKRSVLESLDKGWELLRSIPKSELSRVNKELINRFYSEIMEDGTKTPFY
ncbi:MAG: V-type ATP synthase subunit B [Chitinivibrionales bacterium]|nr:V-type ATP synthase subunit B [Chitinivibrionales bacterium]